MAMKHMKLLLLPILLVGIISCESGDKTEKEKTAHSEKETSSISVKADDVPDSPYAFGDLPYSADALEPHIDAEIMRLHYGKHHKGYYKKFLNAIEGSSIEGEELSVIFSKIDNHDASVRNNAGGYYNHWVFWHNMSPEGGGEPGSALKAAISDAFGSMDNFFSEFNTAAKSQFGSGWAWLIMDENGELMITNTPNQDNPLMNTSDYQGYPLLAIDVWEHAYYLQYKNERGSYIEAFRHVIDWEEVSRRYQMALEGKHYIPHK